MTEEHIRNFWQASDFNINTNAWIVTTQDEKAIGLALLQDSFAEFYRRETYTVKLMVDTQNTGATRLYGRAGMHITQLYHQYEKELRPAKN